MRRKKCRALLFEEGLRPLEERVELQGVSSWWRSRTAYWPRVSPRSSNVSGRGKCNQSIAGFLRGISFICAVSEVEDWEIIVRFSGRSDATHREGRPMPLCDGGLSVRRDRVSARLRALAVQRQRSIAQRLFLMGVEREQTQKRALSGEAALRRHVSCPGFHCFDRSGTSQGLEQILLSHPIWRNRQDSLFSIHRKPMIWSSSSGPFGKNILFRADFCSFMQWCVPSFLAPTGRLHLPQWTRISGQVGKGSGSISAAGALTEHRPTGQAITRIGQTRCCWSSVCPGVPLKA